ncbi:MAG: GTP 3',8-cyclase MoaA [Mariprofundaceae bacterium]
MQNDLSPIRFFDKAPSGSSPLIDRFDRHMNYLRISVTDRCNLKCTYCRPGDDSFCPLAHAEVLSFEEIVRIVRIAAGLGVNKVRLTGGEPLVRRGITTLIQMLKEIPGIDDLALSTNAVLLGKHAQSLADAGLSRINISLDTIQPERFKTLTGGGKLETALNGIRAAVEAGFSPIKVNAVVMRGVNEDEIADLIDFAAETGVQMRFIEFMPLCDGNSWSESHVPVEEMLSMPGVKERLVDISSANDGHAAARYIPLSDRYADRGLSAKGVGEVGFISPMSNRFCDGCNRLRLTADGKIRPCLPADDEIDLRSVLRTGCSDAELEQCLRDAVLMKPEVGIYNFETNGRKRSMVQIGG